MEQTEMNRCYERVKKILPGGVHYNFNLPWEEKPIFYKKTKGSRVWDIDGNEYLDLYARFGAMILGHQNEEYLSSLQDAMNRVLCVSHCDLDPVVLEQISHNVPCAEMVRFGLSGTEIVQNSIRLARAYTGRDKFIRFTNHYHGNADNIMGGKASKKTSVPREYRGDYKGTLGRESGAFEHSYLLPWNDSNVLENFLKEHNTEIAAIITEPICVNGGSVMPKEGYLQKMRALCDNYGIVLIFDEIITGIRTGLGGAQKLFSVTPDLALFGKALAGGGVPVSALVGKCEIMSLYSDKKVVHAGTFNGYPLGTAAVNATLNILEKDNGIALSNMNEMAEKIHKVLIDEAREAGIPLVIQGHPSCAAFHCCDTQLKSPSEYSIDVMTMDVILNSIMQKHGILISSVSRIYPNISLDNQDIEWFSEHCRSAMKEAKEILQALI